MSIWSESDARMHLNNFPAFEYDFSKGYMSFSFSYGICTEELLRLWTWLSLANWSWCEQNIHLDHDYTWTSVWATGSLIVAIVFEAFA